jgi:hypothetical protein
MFRVSHRGEGIDADVIKRVPQIVRSGPPGH